MDTLRCLFLAPFVPYPPHDGGRLRVHELMRALAPHHEVDLLAMSDGSRADRDAARELRDQGFRVELVPVVERLPVTAIRALAARRSLYGTRYRSPAFAAAVERAVHGGAYDVIQAEYVFTGQYRPPARPGGPAWLLDEHNVEFRLNETLAGVERGVAYRLYARRESRLRRREELDACRRADHVVVVSPDDGRVLAAELPGLRCSVVPNGVDVDRYAPRTTRDEGAGAALTFVGKMDYRPNIDGVRWFCSEVLPLLRERRPDTTLTIVGADPVAAVRELERLDGVRVSGRVADTRPYLQRAAVVVVPLRAGSGTRLKVLEALAAAKPVVSTSLGAEGLEVTSGEQLELADGADAFADAVLGLLDDPARARALGHRGRALTEARYSWSAIGRSLEDTYRRTLQARDAVALVP